VTALAQAGCRRAVDEAFGVAGEGVGVDGELGLFDALALAAP
jgi:hypothetical protein